MYLCPRCLNCEPNEDVECALIFCPVYTVANVRQLINAMSPISLQLFLVESPYLLDSTAHHTECRNVFLFLLSSMGDEDWIAFVISAMQTLCEVVKLRKALASGADVPFVYL